MNVTYTNEEAQAAIQLYDLAVKANGLSVSEAALHLTKKLQEASRVVPTVPEVPAETEQSDG